MAANCQFAFAVHVLALLAYKAGQEVTSAELALSVNTNPVVIRRLLLTLGRAGLVLTRKGAGAGTRLRRDPAQITLAEIFRATAPASSFSQHPQVPDERCRIGQNIEAALSGVVGSAWQAFEQALARQSLADVLCSLLAEPARGRQFPPPIDKTRASARSDARLTQ